MWRALLLEDAPSSAAPTSFASSSRSPSSRSFRHSELGAAMRNRAARCAAIAARPRRGRARSSATRSGRSARRGRRAPTIASPPKTSSPSAAAPPRGERREPASGRTGGRRASGRDGRTTRTRTRRRPAPPVPADPVELDQVARHVLLDDGARDAARGERRERRRERSAAPARRTTSPAWVAWTSPRLTQQRKVREPAARGLRPASGRERSAETGRRRGRRGRSCGRGRCCGSPAGRLTITRPRALPAREALEVGMRSHMTKRNGGARAAASRACGSSSGVFSTTSKPAPLELLGRRPEDQGVVGLAPGRVRELPVDAPAARCALTRAVLARRARAGAASSSASADVLGPVHVHDLRDRDGPASARPTRTSQARNSRSRPSAGGGCEPRARARRTRRCPRSRRRPGAADRRDAARRVDPDPERLLVGDEAA